MATSRPESGVSCVRLSITRASASIARSITTGTASCVITTATERGTEMALPCGTTACASADTTGTPRAMLRLFAAGAAGTSFSPRCRQGIADLQLEAWFAEDCLQVHVGRQSLADILAAVARSGRHPVSVSSPYRRGDNNHLADRRPRADTCHRAPRADSRGTAAPEAGWRGPQRRPVPRGRRVGQVPAQPPMAGWAGPKPPMAAWAGPQPDSRAEDTAPSDSQGSLIHRPQVASGNHRHLAPRSGRPPASP